MAKGKPRAHAPMPPAATPTHIKDLTPDPNQFRTHTERGHALLVEALHEVGAARSIVIDENDVILAGNGVVEAAAEAGIERVRVVEASGDEIIAVRRRNLTDGQKQRLALYDNRAPELSAWDVDKLSAAFAATPAVATKLWTEGEVARFTPRPTDIPVPAVVEPVGVPLAAADTPRCPACGQVLPV